MKFYTFSTIFLILFVQCFALDSSIVNRGIAKDVKDAVGKVIDEVKEKVKCVIPRGLSEIARVALLQKCASDEDDGTCYEELGCFPMKDPWVSNLRPVPAPYAPEDINVTLTLFTRNNAKKGWPVDLWPRIVVNDRIYDRRRPRTIFITHGFAASGESDWIIELKDVLLKKLDANIFIVDWKNGSSLINYFQAASNTRVVGAEIGRFANKLIENGLDVKNVYLIGHSLGAHTMGYAAKNIKNALNATNTNSTRVGRITALDPAQPCFEFTSPLVRLDSEDADFIDVFHTDAKPFLPLFGFGMMSPVGDIDYYFNGGQLQPGCIKNAIPTKFMSLDDIRNMTVEVIDGIVSCSHGRASKYLISSLNHTECGFIARSISKLEKVLNVVSLGIAKLITSPIAKMISKRNDTIVGFEADLIPARGNFLIELANHEPPFCDSSSDFKKLKQNIFQTIRNRFHL